MRAITIFFALLPFGLPAQSGSLDSLRRAVAAAPDWQSRMEAQFSLGKNLHKADSIRYYAQQIQKEARARDYPLGTGYAERLLGDADFYQLKYEAALPHYARADSAFQLAGDKSERITALSNAAYALYLQGRYGDAIEKASIGLDLAEQLNERDAACRASRSIAESLIKMGKHRESLPYLHKSLVWLTPDNPADLSYTLLGYAYDGLQMPDSALIFYEKALEGARNLEVNHRVLVNEQALGGHFLKWGNFRQAERHLNAALALLEKTNDKFSEPGLLKALSDLELARGNYAAAAEWAEKALAAIRWNRQNTFKVALLSNLYRAYAGLGQHEKALEYAISWKTASDTLAAQDNARKVAGVESRYRSREQDAVIARQELALGRQRAFLLVGLLALLLVGSLAYVAYARARGKKREADLAHALRETETRQLRDLDRVKSAFFANISHEFRTPLTLLIGPLKEMETGRFQGNAQKHFGIMRRNAERLLQLVSQLLDLSRLESGRLTLHPHPGNLSAALRAMAGSFESLAERKQIHFDVFVPRAPIWAHFDHDKLEKIVSNLLANAFKFTPEEGTVQLRLTTDDLRLAPSQEAASRQSSVVIQVSDTGIGIPAGQLPYIFERFYRVENNGPDTPEGSGIGLALTKELVQLHDGAIEAHSVENKGSTFTVRLPLAPAEPVAESPGTGEQQTEPLVSAAGPEPEAIPVKAPDLAPSVLVVEDNPDLLDYIVAQLQGQFRVLVADNGAAALPIAAAETPDLILTDLMMPGMDGLTLTQHLKNDPRTSHIPIVMLTAKAALEDRIGGLQTGAEAYLTKPFDAGELRALVGRLTEQRRVLQEKYSRMVILGAAPLAPAPSLDEQFLHAVLRVIEENLDDDLFGVEQLAAGVNMSRSNLFRKLDALTGKNPTQLIRELRLARARQLLEQGAGNTTEVAMMVGFNTPAYFVKCFVDQYGVTPGALRKRRQPE